MADIEALRRTAGAAMAAPRVAIVDAPTAIADELERALLAAGFDTTQVDLADFVDGESGYAALLAQGADVVVYVLGSHYQRNSARFRELYEAIADRGTPFLITARLRRGRQEQPGETEQSPNAEATPGVEWLVRMISREVGFRHPGC